MTDLRQSPLQHCATAIPFSGSFVMSCRQRAASSKSQALPPNTLFILREFPDLVFQPSDREPEYSRTSRRGWCGRSECARAEGSGRFADALANRRGRSNPLHQHGPHFTLGGDAWTGQGCGGDPSFEAPFYSTALTIAKASRPRRATRRSTKAFAIATRPGAARPRGGCSDRGICRVLSSDGRRNAGKQSERGVSPV